MDDELIPIAMLLGVLLLTVMLTKSHSDGVGKWKIQAPEIRPPIKEPLKVKLMEMWDLVFFGSQESQKRRENKDLGLGV